MANEVEKVLIEELLDALRREKIVTVTTIDFETGIPNVSALSWIYANANDTIQMAVDNRARMLQNISAHRHIVIQLIANESVYAITGEARVREERIAGIPLPLALIEVSIIEVRDVMFYGSKMTVEPDYEKTYDLQAAIKLDNQVFQVLKKGKAKEG